MPMVGFKAPMFAAVYSSPGDPVSSPELHDAWLESKSGKNAM